MVEKLERMQSEFNDAESWGLGSDNEDDYLTCEECLLMRKPSVAYPGEQKVVSSVTTENGLYSMIDSDKIFSIQKLRIEEVAESLGLSEDLSRSILINNGWHVQSSINALLDDGDYIEKTFKFTLEEGQKRHEENKRGVFTCTCCYCDCEPHEVIEMTDCAHRLCTDCFEGYCKSKVASGPDAIFATCPDQECKMILPAWVYKKCLDTTGYERYNFFLQKSFVEISKNAKWCPGRNCNMVCETKFDHPIDVTCKCGESFCFGCNKEAHKPIDCDTLQAWNDRIENGEEDSKNWMKLNSKPCPKCKSPI